MSAQRFKLAIAIAIVVTLASLIGVLVTANRPSAATNAAAATPSPSPGGHPNGPHGVFPGGHLGRGGGNGTVTGISGGTLTLRTLTGTLTVNTTSSTTYSKEGKSISLGDIKTGDVLQVRPVRSSATGTPPPTPPTTVTAQSILVVLPTFFGRVTQVSGPTIYIVMHDGQEAFVYTTSNTTYTSNNSSASLSDVKAGDYISAEGTQTDLKHLTADQVSISTSAGAMGGPRGGAGPFGPHGPKSPQPSGTAT